jgi:hypothetical protein
VKLFLFFFVVNSSLWQKKHFVNKVFQKFRHTSGTPRSSFSQHLRKKLMHHFFRDDYFFVRFLCHLKSISPKENFRNVLRNELLSAYSPQTSHVPHISLLWRFFRAILLSGASAFVLILIFSPSFQQSSASNNTIITAFFGEVSLVEKNISSKLHTPKTPVSEDTEIRTGKYSGATVRFFEDSVLRMDENTKISVEVLTPNPLQGDIGSVSVSLHSGRIWVKTFSADEHFSHFLVQLPQNSVTLSSEGSLDASVINTNEEIRSWKRFVRVQDMNKEEYILLEGNMFSQNGERRSIRSLSPRDFETDWVLENKAEDEILNAFFVEEKIQQKREKNLGALQKVKKTFVSPFSNTTNEEVLELENIFFESLSLISYQTNTNIKDMLLKNFEKESKRLFKTRPEEVLAFLASAEKILSSALPDSPLFTMKETVETLQIEFAKESDRTLVVEKQRTKRLWEANQLASTGQMQLAEKIVREHSEDLHVEPEKVPEILTERQEQIIALEQIGTESQLTGIAEEAEKKLIQNVSSIVRPGFPTGTQQKPQEKAYEIIRRVKKYGSDRGRENTLRIQLEDIDNTIKNIPVLLELKKRLPETLHEKVDQKILIILSDARKKRE